MNSQWNANPTAYLDRTNRNSALNVSLEMFPPADDVAAKSFEKTLDRLVGLQPSFVSVTSGAGGGGSRQTLETLVGAKRRHDIPFAAHLTCIGKTRDQVQQELDQTRDAGIDHVVALRGDLPADGAAPVSGYRSALELVRAVKSRGDFSISVAAYPEGHPEAHGVDEEIAYLKRKVDAGADRIITQFFFDTEVFARFMDRIRDAGIDVPVHPGILPIVNFSRAVSFAEKCGTRVPRWYHVMYRDLEQDGRLHRAISVSIAVEQCRQLMALGIEDLHFYTLNQSDLTLAICRELGKRDSRDDAAATSGTGAAKVLATRAGARV